jgi:hypothetical protein
MFAPPTAIYTHGPGLRNKSWMPEYVLSIDIGWRIFSRSRRESQSHIHYDGKVSRIDGTFETIILCLHVLIAYRILLILNMLIIFRKYRCLKG